MTGFFIVILTAILGVSSEINSDFETEHRSLYCIDPHTGIYYPVHSTWPSSTFCGTYTCKVRPIEDSRRDYHPKRKETYLEGNIKTQEDFEEVEGFDYEEKDESDPFTIVNLSNPEETSKLYNAAKNLLAALENKVNLKTQYEKMFKTKNNLKRIDEKFSRKDKKGLINLSAEQLKLLFNAAKGLVVQLEDKLRDDNKLSASNVHNLEKLLEVSHRIGNVAENEINNKNDNPHFEHEPSTNPKLLEYLDEYKKYMIEYKKFYENYALINNATTCNVIKNIVSEMNSNDCEMSPSEINQMLYFSDGSGTIQQVAVPKSFSNITIPGKLVDSDSNYNYWNLSSASFETHNIENENDNTESRAKRSVKNARKIEGNDYYKYIHGFRPSNGQSSGHYHQKSIQCPLSQRNVNYIHKSGNSPPATKSSPKYDVTMIMSDSTLTEKFEKAMAAYRDFYNYYVKVFQNKTQIKCSTSGYTGIHHENIELTTETYPSITAEVTKTYQNNEFSTISFKKWYDFTTTPSLIDYKSSTPNHIHPYDGAVVNVDQTESSTKDYSNLYAKLSYYSFDPVSKQYIRKTPKDKVEYQKFLDEYYQVMNESEKSEGRIAEDENKKTEEPDSVPENTSNDERFEFFKTNKRFPSIKEKLKLDSMKYLNKEENEKFQSVQFVNRPIVKEGDVLLQLNEEQTTFNYVEREEFPKTETTENLADVTVDMDSEELTTTEQHSHQTSEHPHESLDNHPTVSYYNFDPISGEYVIKTPKTNEEYNRYLQEYHEAMKHYESPEKDSVAGASSIEEKIRYLGERAKHTVETKLLDCDVNRFQEDFNAFVHFKYSPVSTVTIDRPIVKQDDVVLRVGKVPDRLFGFSETNDNNPNQEDVSAFDFPSIGKRLRRSQYDPNRFEAYITVQGCPETLEPGYFRKGDNQQFFPKCCPQKIP